MYQSTRIYKLNMEIKKLNSEMLATIGIYNTDEGKKKVNHILAMQKLLMAQKRDAEQAIEKTREINRKHFFNECMENFETALHLEIAYLPSTISSGNPKTPYGKAMRNLVILSSAAVYIK